jgi:hypothetical protein
MGYASQAEDDEKRRQDADSGIEEFLARSRGVGGPGEPARWRWALRFRGRDIAYIAEIGRRGGWGTAGTLVSSPEFERFRPYFKDARSHGWSDHSRAAAHDPLFVEVNSAGGFDLYDSKTRVLHRDVRLQVSGQDVRFRPR